LKNKNTEINLFDNNNLILKMEPPKMKKRTFGLKLELGNPKEEAIVIDPDAKNLTNKYTLIKELGSGAFKSAYYAQNKLTGENVVLFYFKKSILSPENKREIQIFKRMLQKIKSCSENVICPIEYGYIQEDGEVKYILVTNFIKGITLREFLDNKNNVINVSDKIDIMISLIKGLDFLHNELGFVHFDLKPENIQIEKQKTGYIVSIIDLGTGCFITDKQEKESCEWHGTEKYASPEVLDPISANFSMKSSLPLDWQKIDIFAMGKIFQEILDFNPQNEFKYKLDESELPLQNLINQMTYENMKRRPFIVGILQNLEFIKKRKSAFVKIIPAFKRSLSFSALKSPEQRAYPQVPTRKMSKIHE
jgi:serine/threonine protein kinase